MGERESGYFPTLDGWRAIAVVSTILYHDSRHVLGPSSTDWFQKYGAVGVDIFFGISGLLICSRLLQEEQAQGRINLREFYIRRFFRIVPPMLLFLLVIGALAAVGLIYVMGKEWLAALLFFRNYSWFSAKAQVTDWFTSHYWSLSVEEHFYFFLPGLLFFVPKRLRMTALGTLVALIGARRFYLQVFRHVSYLAIYKHTDVRLDALLIPAMLAIALQNQSCRDWFKRLGRLWFAPAIVSVALLTSEKFPVLTPLAQSFLIPIMLAATVMQPAGIFAQMLEWPVARWIGRISYSLYLWQQLFFVGHFLKDYQPLGFLNTFPVNWLMVFGCAALSYYLVERPLIRLGHKYAAPATPGRPEIAASGVAG